ncbi:hypothetical protein P4679_24290 [Priestia megaterium]|uniref:hypothetical protein n=1 Tax=Priestia megaterium TaxID=1404 RepID=UPI002E232380|nr:hypothetical protein [Priestia megaterium]
MSKDPKVITKEVVVRMGTYRGVYGKEYPTEIKETFEKVSSPIFCPECGRTKIWVEGEDSTPGFHQGYEYFCLEGKHTFTLPYAGPASEDQLKIIEQLLEYEKELDSKE